MPLAVTESVIDLRDDVRRFRSAANEGSTVRRLLHRVYPQLLRPGSGRSSACCDDRLRLYSQYDEDGKLLAILDRIGVGTHTFIEIGVGIGRECNTANLSLNFGWSGLLIEGGARNAELAQRFYRRHAGGEVVVIHGFATAENIDGVIASAGFSGTVDVLSIDIDGMDYWIWKAIHAVTPRVVVIEYNRGLGVDAIEVTPYDPRFDRFRYSSTGLVYGASLGALARLGKEMSYRLVGTTAGLNAFFVRDDAAEGLLRELSPTEADGQSLFGASVP
jgi:hypothetical protein